MNGTSMWIMGGTCVGVGIQGSHRDVSTRYDVDVGIEKKPVIQKLKCSMIEGSDQDDGAGSNEEEVGLINGVPLTGSRACESWR